MLPLLLTALLACDLDRLEPEGSPSTGLPTTTTTATATTSPPVDADLDGWPIGEDCNDADPAVNPGAIEVCNDGVDDDCNGKADDEDGAVDLDTGTAWYQDGDGDQYGEGPPVRRCSQPQGYVLSPDDCDDSSPEVHPGANEVCNSLDDDCDGLFDDDDPSLDLSTAGTWYTDADNDRYGDPDTRVQACRQPADTTTTADDCDDGMGSVHPGAAEVCNSLDDDCDGLEDDDDDDVDFGSATTWYGDGDGDGHGDADVATFACSPPVGTVALSDDCDDSDRLVFPGATEVCNDTDDDCDGKVDDADTSLDLSTASTWYTDADRDGYGDGLVLACDQPSDTSAKDGDCDDASREVNPGASEVCNGLDDDCDALIDDDDSSVDASTETTWYLDGDRDGYGDPATASSSCDAPTGGVTNDDDCDDSDRLVSPAASEVCNTLDDDCDLKIDDADPSLDLSTTSTWWKDADLDGYGGNTTSQKACEAPANFVASSTDCLDTAPSVNPGATEICNDIDDDCDLTIDDDDTSLDTTTTTSWYPDGDGDGQGSASGGVLACDEPAGTVANDDDCDDTNPLTYEGATELCDGEQNDCADTSWSDAGTVTFYGSSGEVVSYTSTLGSSSVATATFNDDGELRFCDGTFNVSLTLAADLAVTGFNGSGSTTLTGLGSKRVLTAAGGVTVQLTGLKVADGYSDVGGGLHAETDAILLEDVHFYANEAYGTHGGGFYGAADTITMTDVTFELNVADEVGGGALLYPTVSLVVDGGAFVDNAALSGGGLFVYGGTTELVDTLFEANTASEDGGHLYTWDTTAVLDGVSVSTGSAGGDGGAHVHEGGSLTVARSTYAGSAAGGDGGLLWLVDTTATFDESTLSGGSAGGNGGGIHLDGGELWILDSRLEGNTAQNGGGIFLGSSDGWLIDSQITKNDADDYGGGAYADYADLICERVSDDTAGFTSNEAGIDGGAVLLFSLWYTDELESIACDWGSGSDDNTPDDVQAGLWSETFGTDESFVCDIYTGC